MELTDSYVRQKLFPFTHTRHAADIRVGILTIREKWNLLAEYFSDKVPLNIQVPANILPTKANAGEILDFFSTNDAEASHEFPAIIFPWQIYQMNDQAIRDDFALLTEGRKSAQVPAECVAIAPHDIFIEDGARVSHSILNASAGPIYVGRNAEIMEGCLLRGPLAMGENARLKMGTKVYGATTIGPGCICGGEIKNSVLFANSNKAHDGYLGDSVLGEWCNLGAGTSNSNVKNTGGEVKYQLTADGSRISAGTKGGLLMGDYSRAAINTSFNTGAVVGICCNIFGSVAPGSFTNNFTWGAEKYLFDKAIRDIDTWKKMKNDRISESETETLKTLYQLTFNEKA